MQNNYQRIAKLISYLEENSHLQPNLDDLAKLAGLSPTHLQKIFKSWAGVSPKQYLKIATLKKAKYYLRENNSVLDTSYRSGLSSSGRLYDHFITIDAVTPGEYKTGGAKLAMFCGCANGPYGTMFIAWTDRGIHHLLFSDSTEENLAKLKSVWPYAKIVVDDNGAKNYLTSIFTPQSNTEIVLRPKGSNFQIQVWKALLTIPSGHCLSYGNLATILGNESAARAVGSAVGANTIAILIPCHRVIQATGTIGEYRWGELRKRIVLAQEYCLQEEFKEERF